MYCLITGNCMTAHTNRRNIPTAARHVTCATQAHQHRDTQWCTLTHTCDFHWCAAAQANSHLQNISNQSRRTPLVPDCQLMWRVDEVERLLGTHSTFLCNNKMLPLGVCCPQTCLSAGRRFAASRSCLQYYWSFRFHHKKIDKMRYKLDSTENLRPFERFPTPLRGDLELLSGHGHNGNVYIPSCMLPTELLICL